MNHDQTVIIIASSEDGIYYNFRTRKFIDLDEKYDISNIKEIMIAKNNVQLYLKSGSLGLAFCVRVKLIFESLIG